MEATALVSVLTRSIIERSRTQLSTSNHTLSHFHLPLPQIKHNVSLQKLRPAQQQARQRWLKQSSRRQQHLEQTRCRCCPCSVQVILQQWLAVRQRLQKQDARRFRTRRIGRSHLVARLWRRQRPQDDPGGHARQPPRCRLWRRLP